MDVTISLVTGGGKKANRVTHSKTIKEVQTMAQVIEEFEEEFAIFFPAQATLTVEKRKAKA
jgi:hypothetical protein